MNFRYLAFTFHIDVSRDAWVKRLMVWNKSCYCGKRISLTSECVSVWVCVCVCVCGDAMPLNVPSQLCLLYLIEMNRGQGRPPTRHHSPQEPLKRPLVPRLGEQLGSCRCLCAADGFVFLRSQECCCFLWLLVWLTGWFINMTSNLLTFKKSGKNWEPTRRNRKDLTGAITNVLIYIYFFCNVCSVDDSPCYWQWMPRVRVLYHNNSPLK